MPSPPKRYCEIIFFLCAKNDREDMTPEQKKAVRDAVEVIKKDRIR